MIFRATTPRKRFDRVVLLILWLASLAGCAHTTKLETFADDAKEQIAEEYIRRVAAGETESLAAELEPKLQTPGARAEIAKMRTFFPAEPPTVKNLVGYQFQFGHDGKFYNLTYQLGYGTRWVLANAAWRELADGRRVIAGLTVRPLPEPLQVTHRFTFARARPQHYVFLAAIVAVVGFIAMTLIVCIRTKFRRRKWLWILLILLGVTQVSLNWTTGEVSFNPLHCSLFGAGAMTATAYTPWFLSVGVPLGAIVFWIRRRGLAARQETAPPVLPPTAPAS